MLIDIHTHNLQVKNTKNLRFLVGRHSLGFHPWELTIPFDQSLLNEKFSILKKQFHQKIFAIGECGLDRRRAGIVDINIQEMVLGLHMDWAQEVHRPLILHCGKAEADLLKILKARRYQGRILLHDYAGNFKTAKAFLKYDCFFSFGRSLFNSNAHAASLIKSLPRNKIFLETDNQTDFSIEDIYHKAELLLNLDAKSCEELFLDNLLKFFSDLDNISSSDIINDLGTSIAS